MSGETSVLKRLLTRAYRHIETEEINIRIPGLSPGLEALRVALVSDLHMTRDVKADAWENILAAVRGARPGLIAVCGDTIDLRVRDVERLRGFFEPLAAIAPSVAILGNNDCLPARIDSLRRMYAESGVTLLEDETRLFHLNGAPLKVTGLSDPKAAEVGIVSPHENGAETESKAHMPLEEAVSEDFGEHGVRVHSLLLLHKPHLAARYAPMRPTLILTGHAHGGQFRLPLIGPLFAPGQGLFPKLTSGAYACGGVACLVVSRGLGNNDFPIRVGNRFHLPVVVLKGR